jgi:DNA-binding MarR family transcriptional regulator
MSTPHTTDTALAAELLYTVARLNRLASQRVHFSLPFAQARLLAAIEDQGTARISDLAELDHCSQPTMTMQVRKLEDAGLVSRATDPSDARAVLISITPEGLATLDRVRAARSAVIDPYLDRLDQSDRQTLADAVRIMRALLEEAQQQRRIATPPTEVTPTAAARSASPTAKE